MATKLGHGLRTALQSPIIAALGVVSLAQPLLEATGLLAAPAPQRLFLLLPHLVQWCLFYQLQPSMCYG